MQRQRLCVVIACGVLLTLLVPFSTQPAPMPDDPVLKTLFKGLEYRSSILDAVTCSAVVETTYGEAYNTERRQRSIANQAQLAQARMAESGPEAADEVLRNVPEMGNTEARWIDFSCDRNERKWRIEVVALTNNGQPNPGCGLNAALRENRHSPPELFYQAWVTDGEKIYNYDRSVREGSIRQFTGDADLRNTHYRELQTHALQGVSPTILEEPRNGINQAVYLGQHHVEPFGQCHEVAVIRRAAGHVRIDKFQISPDLGFAVVQSSAVYCRLPIPASNEGAVPSRLYTVRCEDFAEIAPGIWCARRLQTDSFHLERGEGIDAWDYRNLYRIIDLKVNEPVQLATPYPFPFDTRITDFTEDPPSSSKPPPEFRTEPATPDFPEDTLEDLLGLLDQVEQ